MYNCTTYQSVFIATVWEKEERHPSTFVLFRDKLNKFFKMGIKNVNTKWTKLLTFFCLQHIIIMQTEEYLLVFQMHIFLARAQHNFAQVIFLLLLLIFICFKLMLFGKKVFVVIYAVFQIENEKIINLNRLIVFYWLVLVNRN